MTDQRRGGIIRAVICCGMLPIVALLLAANLMCSCQRAGGVTIYSYALLGTDIVISNSGQYGVYPSGVDVAAIKQLKNGGSFSSLVSLCFELIHLPIFILSSQE